MLFKGKRRRNQLVERAEEVIKEIGFTGILEEDLKRTENAMKEQAYLVETLLYKYENSRSLLEKEQALERLEEELRILNKLIYQAPNGSDPKEVYKQIIKEASNEPQEATLMINGNRIHFKAYPCGEYYDGSQFVKVIASSIRLNGESLYEDVPQEGIWSCATRHRDVRMVNCGNFDYPMDAIGYIEYITQ